MININIECKLNGNTFHPQDVVIDTKLGEIYNVASFSVIRPPNLNDEVEFIVGDFSCKGFVHKISENIGKYTVEVRSYGAKLSSPYSKNIRTIISGANTTELLGKISPMIENRLPEYKTFGGVAREGTLKSVIDNLIGFMQPDIYANKDKIIIYPRRGTDGEAIKVNDDDIIGNINVDIQTTDDVCGSVVVYQKSYTSTDSEYDDTPNTFEESSSFGSIDSTPPAYTITISNGIAKILVDKDCVTSIDGVSESSFSECVEDIEEFEEQLHLDIGTKYLSLSNNALPLNLNGYTYPLTITDENGKNILSKRNDLIKNGVDILENIDDCTVRVKYSTYVYYATPIYNTDGSFRVVVKSKCGNDLVAEGIDSTYLGTSEKCGISLPYELKVNLMTNFGLTIEEARIATASFNGHLVEADKYGVATYEVLVTGTIQVTAYVPSGYANEPQKEIGSVTYKVQ